MTDRELLELAAKAAGYAVESYTDDGAWVYEAESPENEDNEHPIFLWRPRADDGDALRLAVKLGLFVDSYPPATTVGNVVDPASLACKTCMEDHNGDPYAATRRAVVRAAAEIGKAL